MCTHSEITALLDAGEKTNNRDIRHMCSNLRKANKRVAQAAVCGTIADFKEASKKRTDVVRRMQEFMKNGKGK